MSNTREFLEGIFSGQIPVTRRNPQTGAKENVYYNYDEDRDQLEEAGVYHSRASQYFHQPMAFAQATPVNRETLSSQWRTLAHHNYNEDGSHFERVLENTLGEEGGYEDQPEMIEEPTNYGIKQATLTNYRNRHPEAGYPEQVRDLRANQAKNIYFEDYYRKYRVNNVKDNRLSKIVFDMFVMSNPNDVAGIIQQGLIDSGYNVEKDRVLGSESIGALNAATDSGDANRVAENIIRNRRDFLNSLPNRNRYPGWLHRTNRY